MRRFVLDEHSKPNGTPPFEEPVGRREAPVDQREAPLDKRRDSTDNRGVWQSRGLVGRIQSCTIGPMGSRRWRVK
jgi:hypothetical protein